MIFSSNFDRREVISLIYVKFWKEACLPTLLYGAGLFTRTLTLLLRVLPVLASQKIFFMFPSLHLGLYF